jgi:hypothetical protein
MLKSDEVVKQLASNGYNIAQTMRKVGYTEQGSRSGSNYAVIRKKLEVAYSPEAIKAKILKAERKFIKDGDNSNYARMVELQTKVAGLGKDSNATQVNVNINDTLARLKEDKPIDVSSSGTTS